MGKPDGCPHTEIALCCCVCCHICKIVALGTGFCVLEMLFSLNKPCDLHLLEESCCDDAVGFEGFGILVKASFIALFSMLMWTLMEWIVWCWGWCMAQLGCSVNSADRADEQQKWGLC